MTGHPDAGTDVRRTVDAARDLGTRPDAVVIVDTGVSLPWPVIPGCTTGFPPSPRFTPRPIPPITVSCASTVAVILQITDAGGQGMLFETTLDPPITGFFAIPDGPLCVNNGVSQDVSVRLRVAQSAAVPGEMFSTNLRITPMGPPQPDYLFPLIIMGEAIDFTVDPTVIDFGTLNLGTRVQTSVMVTNASDSTPFQGIYAAQPQLGPFGLISSGSGELLQPGDSQPMLQASVTAQMLGTFEERFLVSPFQPGVPIDPACGVIRTLTMRVQVVPALPPIPGP